MYQGSLIFLTKPSQSLLHVPRYFNATLQDFFISLVALWPLAAQVWSPVKNFSRLIKLTL